MNEPGTQLSLLMVEDSDEDYEATMRALNKLGVSAEVIRCTDGDDALDLLRRRGAYTARSDARAPNLILLDLNLPTSDGCEVLAEIKNDTTLRSIPVVILTTSASPKDIEACYRNGANSYLRKPMNLNQFTSMLRLVCDYWFGTVLLPEPAV